MGQLSREEFHRLVFKTMAEMKKERKKQMKKEVTQILRNQLVMIENRVNFN